MIEQLTINQYSWCVVQYSFIPPICLVPCNLLLRKNTYNNHGHINSRILQRNFLINAFSFFHLCDVFQWYVSSNTLFSRQLKDNGMAWKSAQKKYGYINQWIDTWTCSWDLYGKGGQFSFVSFSNHIGGLIFDCKHSVNIGTKVLEVWQYLRALFQLQGFTCTMCNAYAYIMREKKKTPISSSYQQYLRE